MDVVARSEVERDVGDIDFTDGHLLALSDAHDRNRVNFYREVLSYFKRFDRKTTLKSLLFSIKSEPRRNSKLAPIVWLKQGLCKSEDLSQEGGKVARQAKLGRKQPH